MRKSAGAVVMISGGLKRHSSSGSVAKFAAVRTAPALILQGKAGSDDADELGADFLASPPDHLVFALPDNTIAG
jgi:hypothetical protein